MRRICIILLCISLSGVFAGCSEKTSTEVETGDAVTQGSVSWEAAGSDAGSDRLDGAFIEVKPQCPPSYGVSFWLPADWTYEGVQSEDDPTGDLVVSIRPNKKDLEGAITIGYMAGFGVCGTGLVQKDILFNGHEARQGFYDGNPQWSFICLKEPKDCVIINYAGSWYEEYRDEIDRILATVSFVYYENSASVSEPEERIYDSGSFDIDGDGIIEDCTIAAGPTSGLFTVVVTASANGTIRYKNTFNLAFGELSFGEKNGLPCIVRVRKQDEPEPRTEYLSLSVQDGRIVIDGLAPAFEGYWGDSKWNYDRKEPSENAVHSH